jgi:hypothetical protein
MGKLSASPGSAFAISYGANVGVYLHSSDINGSNIHKIDFKIMPTPLERTLPLVLAARR